MITQNKNDGYSIKCDSCEEETPKCQFMSLAIISALNLGWYVSPDIHLCRSHKGNYEQIKSTRKVRDAKHS